MKGSYLGFLENGQKLCNVLLYKPHVKLLDLCHEKNRLLQGSEHCYTWAVLAKVLSSTPHGSFFPNGGRISGYFDTKYTAVVLIEPILHNFEDLIGLFSHDTHHFWVQ